MITDENARKLQILREVVVEADRQVELWGEQNHPDGTGLSEDAWRADRMKTLNAYFVETKTLTWRDILLEEVYEVFAETDVDKIHEELIQVAAVALQWADALARRGD
jgi:hypothetical protein